MVTHTGIFKNNQNTLFPCFTFTTKTGFSFYSVRRYFRLQSNFFFSESSIHLINALPAPYWPKAHSLHLGPKPLFRTKKSRPNISQDDWQKTSWIGRRLGSIGRRLRLPWQRGAGLARGRRRTAPNHTLLPAQSCQLSHDELHLRAAPNWKRRPSPLRAQRPARPVRVPCGAGGWPEPVVGTWTAFDTAPRIRRGPVVALPN